VFRDLGFLQDEAEHLVVRSDLMIAVQKALERRGCRLASGFGFRFRGERLVSFGIWADQG
jgi:hypothetical protein